MATWPLYLLKKDDLKKIRLGKESLFMGDPLSIPATIEIELSLNKTRMFFMVSVPISTSSSINMAMSFLHNSIPAFLAPVREGSLICIYFILSVCESHNFFVFSAVSLGDWSTIIISSGGIDDFEINPSVRANEDTRFSVGIIMLTFEDWPSICMAREIFIWRKDRGGDAMRFLYRLAYFY